MKLGPNICVMKVSNYLIGLNLCLEIVTKDLVMFKVKRQETTKTFDD